MPCSVHYKTDVSPCLQIVHIRSSSTVMDCPFETNLFWGTGGCLSSTKRHAKPSIIRFLFVGLLEEMTAMISKKLEWNRVKNNETLNQNSRHLWRTLKPSIFDGFPLYRAVKALHLQAIMTSWDKVVWLGVTVRMLIAQWCNIKKSSVFLLLNMHIIRSSWQMLYFQCLIIRFYRFSLILPKRKKNNYLSPHFMPLSVWNFWPWIIITIMIKIILNYYYLFSAIIHSKYFPNSDRVKARA